MARGRSGSESASAAAAASYRAVERHGWEILVGKGARANDLLTFEVAEPGDLWLHVANWPGSHVVIRVPDGAGDPPGAIVDYAARLAAWHSKARGSRGKVEVHFCSARDVRKPRQFEPGMVRLSRWSAIKVYAKDPAAN